MATDTGAARARYLDASALVMLHVDEGDCSHLRAFCNGATNLQTVQICLVEALGALKRKWRHNQITLDDYYRETHSLIARGRYQIYPTEPELTDLSVQPAVEALARKHGLDLADALQLFTLQHGPFSHLCGDSTSVLISGDRGLVKAATAEGIRVWYCREGPAPDWV